MQGYVYFLRSKGSGHVKIGFSICPKRRFATMRTALPEGIELLALVPGATTLERRLHRAAAASSVGGEWFKFDEHVRALMDETVATHGSVALNSTAPFRRDKRDEYTAQAAEWVVYLESRVASRQSISVLSARKLVAVATGLPEGTLFNLRRSRMAAVSVDAYSRLRDSVLAEQRRELADLRDRLTEHRKLGLRLGTDLDETVDRLREALG